MEDDGSERCEGGNSMHVCNFLYPLYDIHACIEYFEH